MTMTNRAFDPAFLAALQQASSSAPGPVAAPPRFHEALREFEDKPVRNRYRSWESSWPYRRAMRKEAPRKTSTLAHLWSWLKKKCPVTPDKRLRLAENIPLGEKRFVALVSVDDREFLIGGSASGVSLLSQWESATDSPAADKQVVTIRESFE